MDKETAIITGADGGMGEYVTCALAQAGFSVIMACYNVDHGKSVREKIVMRTGNQDIEVRQIDLSSLASVENFAKTIIEEKRNVKRLVNNAGVLTTTNRKSADGLETLVSVNYVAPYLLTRLLVPLMSKGSRIINTVSCTYAIGKIEDHFFENGRNGSFLRIPVYSNTKLALLLFTHELAERLKEKGITVNASDPGIVSTNMISMNAWFDPLTDLLYRPFIKTAAQGASTAIYLALSDQVAYVTGECYAESKKKKVPSRIKNNPCRQTLWNDTEDILSRKGFIL